MTIRNFLPGFGMRYVAALAVAAAVVVAALLTVGSPVSAQVIGGEIWSETMTVGTFPVGKGWTLEHGGLGSLSDTAFSSGPNNHLVNLILDSSAPSNQLHMAFKDRLNDNELKSMFLLLGGQGFDFEDATYSFSVTYEHTYTWAHDPLFGWTTGQTVAVKILGDPVIAIEAVTTTVEYGGNNNAAESTAEFRFTRYGITENEQSFRVTNGGIFTPGAETLERKFTAGQSSFSNFHWAVDVLTNGDRVCSIVWTLRTGNDYFRGTPNEAVVDVEGPGTTCSGGM